MVFFVLSVKNLYDQIQILIMVRPPVSPFQLLDKLCRKVFFCKNCYCIKELHCTLWVYAFMSSKISPGTNIGGRGHCHSLPNLKACEKYDFPKVNVNKQLYAVVMW